MYILQELELINAPPESSFDHLTRLASNVIGTPVSLVSIIDFDGDRQVFKSQTGLDEPWACEGQTPVSHSFCKHVVLTNEALVVENASEHSLVKDNMAIRDLNVAAYLGIPVHSFNGQPLGALCVIDNVPRRWSHNDIELMSNLARCVSDVIGLKSESLTNERLRQEQRDIAYAISHDLKAPVNTLKMLVHELMEGREELNSNEQTLLDIARSCTVRITRQIEAVSRYTRSLKMSESHDLINLNTLCTEILCDLRADISDSKADIECGQLPEITGDRSQIKMLFENLLINALRYQPSDQKPVVRVYANTGSGNRVRDINVNDNGIGIAPKYHDRIFKIFSRLHTQKDYPGSGIGLTLCRRVAANHGGSLLVSSTPGAGATFTLRLAMTST